MHAKHRPVIDVCTRVIVKHTPVIDMRTGVIDMCTGVIDVCTGVIVICTGVIVICTGVIDKHRTVIGRCSPEIAVFWRLWGMVGGPRALGIGYILGVIRQPGPGQSRPWGSSAGGLGGRGFFDGWGRGFGIFIGTIWRV